ncbi:MAG: HAMP domain-containing sensor histidine kinase [Pseudomonadota bacterium]
MSSVRHTFYSRTFKVAAGLSTSIAALVLLGIGIYSYSLASEERTEIRERIVEELESLADSIEEDGLDGVFSHLRDEFGPNWPRSEAQNFVEEHEVLILVMQNNQPALGFAELRATTGWQLIRYPGLSFEDAGEGGLQLQALQVDINEEISLVGALPHSKIVDDTLDLWRPGIRIVLFLAVPLALLCSFLVAHYVQSRMRILSTTVAKIASGDLDARAPVGSADDEFDAVATDTNKMLTQIRDLMRNLENVSVGIAHDLRTPLTRLDQRLQSIGKDIERPDAIHAHLDAAHDHVRTLLDTFNALLRLGEIESGRQRENFQAVDLSQLADELAETYEPVFRESGRSLDRSIMNNIEVNGDASLLAQLVSNLLENIIEHSDSNSDAWIRLQPHANGAILQIGDSGPGIPKDDHKHVFERFFRVDKSRRAPGNGLGLSLVASIAKLHAATVRLHDKQPGTVIDIIFTKN